MNGTEVFKDNYRGVFYDQNEFLECLKRIGKNSFWERKKSKNLRLVAITEGSRMEKELREQYVNEGLDEEIITDTVLNTPLFYLNHKRFEKFFSGDEEPAEAAPEAEIIVKQEEVQKFMEEVGGQIMFALEMAS